MTLIYEERTFLVPFVRVGKNHGATTIESLEPRKEVAPRILAPSSQRTANLLGAMVPDLDLCALGVEFPDGGSRVETLECDCYVIAFGVVKDPLPAATHRCHLT